MSKKRVIAKILSLVVIIAAIGVMAGWIFDIGVLKSIMHRWISMKFPTAIAFVLSGITLYFICRAQEGQFDKAQVVLSITSLLIILLMGILFISAVLKLHTGIEDLFIQDTSEAGKTVIPGQPSVPTALNFILIATAAILTMLNSNKLNSKLKIIGVIVGIIGGLAIVGYATGVPLLYYFIEGRNSAMAFNTAVLFVFLGTGLVCLSN